MRLMMMITMNIEKKKPNRYGLLEILIEKIPPKTKIVQIR